MSFEWPAGDAKPGQFLMVRVSEELNPLLRRPMSIADITDGAATVMYKLVGRGTAILSRKKTGDWIDVLGPFGNHFDPPEDKKNIVIIAGGIGVPPLLFFAKHKRDRNIVSVIGGASKDDIIHADRFAELGAAVIITTEDGSMGRHGVVTDALMELEDVNTGNAYIVACGPNSMLRAVDLLTIELGLEGELAIEKGMACGFGACLGCIVETVHKKQKVCVDGPVFRMGEVKWE